MRTGWGGNSRRLRREDYDGDRLEADPAKVLSSGGEKKFFFAYGVGKRKDKKGDGELAIGGQKPKKQEIEGALDSCKEVMEGICWVGKGKDDSSTVYFQCKGKKLSQMVVAKMALTAKAITSRQQDFQIPTEAEETRVANIKEGVTDEIPPAPPLPLAKGTASPPPEKKAEPTAQPSQTTDGQDKQKLYKENLDKWSGAIKAAMVGGGPNAGAVGKLLAQANAASKPDTGNIDDALAKLKECFELATQRPETSSRAGVDDLTREWKEKLADWTPAIKKAMTGGGPSAGPVGKLLAQATALSKSDDKALMQEAIAKLTECHQLATAGAATPSEPKSSEATPSNVDFKELMAKLEPQLLEAQKANPDLRAALGGLWTYAGQQVEANDEAKAKTALARLEKAIADALAKAPKTDVERFGTTKGLVAERRAELEKFFADRLAKAEAATEAQVASVEKAIQDKVPDEDPQFLASAIQNALDERYDQVWQKLSKPIESETATPEQILSMVEVERAALASDPLVTVLQKAKTQLGVAADVAGEFGKMFDEVVAQVKKLAAS